MKYCPQCSREFEDGRVFCEADGSPLQARAPRAGQRPSGGLGAGAGLGAAVLSSQPITALGATALQAPTPARGVSAPLTFAPGDDVHETVRSPSRALPSHGGLALDTSRDTISAASRMPAISAEIRMPGTSPSDPPDMLIDSPTIAMKAPVPPGQQPTHDEDGQRNLVGATVAGRYKVLRRLGEGGMGVVYEAIDERLEKRVAVKVLRDDFARRPDVVARFTQEAKSAARIKHENVLDVTDYGQTEDSSFYIAMELLTGTDLADVLQSDGVVSQERGIEVALQVCRALQAAHQKGIVHRDMKPENVFLVRTDDGREVVKIVDFGIAQMKDITGSAEGSRKLTRTGMIFGTPEYMSPEQAAGKPVDQRVDVYASGIILYEMFVGRVPFLGDTFMGILTKHMFEAPPPLKHVNPAVNVAPDLEAIIFKALAKDPAQRYQSMQEFSDDLLRFRAGNRTNAAFAPPSAPVIPPTAAQVLGVGSPAGASPYGFSQQGSPDQAVVPSRTVEGELTGRRKRPVALIIGAALFVLIAAGAIAAVALSKTDAPTVAPPTVAPPTVTPPVAPPVAPPVQPQGVVVPRPVAPPPVAPPTPALIRVRVVAEGFPPRTAVTFAYVDASAQRPPIAPCDDAADCAREVPPNVALTVTAQGRRVVGVAQVTPSREGEEIRVTAATRAPGQRPNNANGHAPSTPRAQGRAEAGCGQVDPRTGLIRICFDQR